MREANPNGDYTDYQTAPDRIVDDLPAEHWDEALAALGGHPLQSSIWGDARAALGVRDHRLARISPSGTVTWMMRVEERPTPFFGPVGWAPKGPTQCSNANTDWWLDPLLRRALMAHGLHLVITDPYIEVKPPGDARSPRPKTIWIDLTRGRDALFAELENKWRNGVRRAAKEGVEVVETDTAEDIAAFVGLCSTISKVKSFHLELSTKFVTILLANRTAATRARLFVAQRAGVLLAAALVLVNGRNWNYFWGGTDRDVRGLRAGEAVQWAIMEAAIAEGATRYDLEGIDEVSNAGTAAFKRKMGGREVELFGHMTHPLDMRGHLLAAAYRMFR